MADASDHLGKDIDDGIEASAIEEHEENTVENIDEESDATKVEDAGAAVDICVQVLASEAPTTTSAPSSNAPTVENLRVELEKMLQTPSHSRNSSQGSARLRPMRGPPSPNILRLLELVGKQPAEVASAIGVGVQEFKNILNHKWESFERWAPVFAKCTHLSRTGLMHLLRRDVGDGERPPTVGENIYKTLHKKGVRVVDQCREYLVCGWKGWEVWRLTPETVNSFFAGKVQEAEEVADFLVRLGDSTDPNNLFSIFIRV